MSPERGDRQTAIDPRQLPGNRKAVPIVRLGIFEPAPILIQMVDMNSRFLIPSKTLRIRGFQDTGADCDSIPVS